MASPLGFGAHRLTGVAVQHVGPTRMTQGEFGGFTG